MIMKTRSPDVAADVARKAVPTRKERRDGDHEPLAVGDKLIFRKADGRVITIKAHNRNPLDDALAALIAFCAGAIVSLLISTLLGRVQ